MMVKAVFIMPNKSIKTEYVTHDENNHFKYEGGLYVVDKKAALFTGRTDTSWSKNILTLMYEYGNPNPISFRTIKKDETVPYTDAEAFKIGMEQKFIKDLMTEGKKLLFVMLLVIVAILLIAINLWFTYGIKKTLSGGAE